jgi:hypothetical protein
VLACLVMRRLVTVGHPETRRLIAHSSEARRSIQSLGKAQPATRHFFE